MGQRLRACRRKRGLRIKDAASRAGVAVGTLSAAESDKRSMRVENLQAIARLYEVTVGWLVEGD